MSTRISSGSDPDTWEDEVAKFRPRPLFSLILGAWLLFPLIGIVAHYQGVPGLLPLLAPIFALGALLALFGHVWGGWRDNIGRSVIGYEVVNMRDGDKRQRFVQKRSLRMPGKYIGHSVLIMPLGGWFARPHMRNAKTGRVNAKWRLRKWECHEMDDGTSTVQVRDRRGNKAVMSVQRAVQVFPGEYSHDLGLLLGDQLRQVDSLALGLKESKAYTTSLIGERREDRRKHGLLVSNLDDLCADLSTVLYEMVGRLEQTDRIKNARGRVDSREAKPLLKYLMDELARLQENGSNVCTSDYKRNSGNEPGARTVVHRSPVLFAD